MFTLNGGAVKINSSSLTLTGDAAAWPKLSEVTVNARAELGVNFRVEIRKLVGAVPLLITTNVNRFRILGVQGRVNRVLRGRSSRDRQPLIAERAAGPIEVTESTETVQLGRIVRADSPVRSCEHAEPAEYAEHVRLGDGAMISFPPP